jgi:hypothetical protein
MTVWRFLHIAAMFAAVSVFLGQGLLSAGIARTGDVRAIRRPSPRRHASSPRAAPCSSWASCSASSPR